MAEASAAKVAEAFQAKGEKASLPKNVQEAIEDVKYHSERQDLLLDAALEREEITQEEYDDHPRRAYRYEVVGGEVVEISMNGKDAELTVEHRTDMAPGGEVDLASVDPTNVDAILSREE
jgi:hypothetical protein